MADNHLKEAAAILNTLVVGKEETIKLALVCVLAGGHLLLDDVPGVGKTTLAQGLAQVLGLAFQRVQFTSDMLPSDLLGTSVYRREHEDFQFHKGPIFSQILLADEINRATPRTQSALLEAMAEKQVSIDGQTHALPQPFFVLATQNPVEQTGVFPLPESQLDRFLMRLSLGYPDHQAERDLLLGVSRREMLKTLPCCLPPEVLQQLQNDAQAVRIEHGSLEYLQRLLNQSRSSAVFRHGLSPRAGLGLLAAAKAHALLSGRHNVWPDDIQSVFVAVAGHRLFNRSRGQADVASTMALLYETPLP